MFKKPNTLRKTPKFFDSSEEAIKFKDLEIAMDNFLICAASMDPNRPNNKKQKTEHYESGPLPTLTGYIARK
jgi:hypothetical protein